MGRSDGANVTAKDAVRGRDRAFQGRSTAAAARRPQPLESILSFPKQRDLACGFRRFQAVSSLRTTAPPS